MNKTEHQMRVEAFMLRGGQEVPLVPTEPSLETRKLRAKLILEEALETITQGLGLLVCTGQSGASISSRSCFEFEEAKPFDLIETIDGCIDVSVVTIGTLSAIGVPDKPFLELVDENNLQKFGPGSSVREDGKIMKPPGHKPPDINLKLQQLFPNSYGGD